MILSPTSPIPQSINDRLLEQLEDEEIQYMFDQNTQRGFGVTQLTPTGATLHVEIRQVFEMSNFRLSTKIFVKTVTRNHNREFRLDTSITQIPLFLKPLPKPLRISFDLQPML